MDTGDADITNFMVSRRCLPEGFRNSCLLRTFEMLEFEIPAIYDGPGS